MKWVFLAFVLTQWQVLIAEEKKSFWEDFAFYCEGDFPSKRHGDGTCDDGDATLFNGLLCAAGDERGCDGVRDAQDSDGRWWRSPRRRRGEGRKAHNSFSRDMSMGVLLYLAATEDRTAAEKWLRWIEKNRPCSVRNPVTGGCTIRGAERFCRNEKGQTCTLSLASWLNMGHVWRFLGLPLHSKMRGALADTADRTVVEEAKRTPPGYQLHLKGVASYLRQLLGIKHTQRKALNEVLMSKQRANPFFRYLAHGPSEFLKASVFWTGQLLWALVPVVLGKRYI